MSKLVKSKRSKNPLALPAVAARPMNLWQDRGDRGEARIEIVPLIDVIFCILVFFLLASLQFSRQQAIGLQLPQASTGNAVAKDKKIVTIDDRGLIYEDSNTSPVTKDSLRQSLTNYHKTNPKGLIVLHASRSISYNEVIQVLDILKSVGGDRVALAILPSESQSNYTDPNLNITPNSNTDSTIPTLDSLPNTNTNTQPNNSIPNSTTTPSIPSLSTPPANNNPTPKQNTVKPTVPPAP
jgi:biopolymer transport protein ExbD